MPLYSYRCANGHSYEEFVHHPDDKGCRTHLCEECHESMAPVLSLGQGLCYFEEGRARRIYNLETSDERDVQGRKIPSKPVYVRSAAEHNRLMRQRGVTNTGQGRGIKGQWI